LIETSTLNSTRLILQSEFITFPPENPIHAVIFDMDGLLLDTEWIGEVTWTYAGRDLGIHVPHELVLLMIGRNMASIRQILELEMPPNTDIGALVSRADFYYHDLIDKEPMVLKPGARELLEWVAALGIPCALATSSQRKQAQHKLERASIAHFLPTRACGDEVDHGKPAPDIFLLAAQRINANPHHCLVLEDSSPGIQGAHAAGMASILVPDRHPPTDRAIQLATTQCTDLFEAREWLAGKLF